MKSFVPTGMLAGSRRIYKSLGGKFFNKTFGGGRTYRPKVTHITRGDRKFVVKPSYRGLPYGMKPKAKYAANGRSVLNRILRGRY
jgi:hypothetical protein